VWSTFGTMILCSLGWDHGPSVTDPIKQVTAEYSLSFIGEIFRNGTVCVYIE
jgi:hypothetical protein